MDQYVALITNVAKYDWRPPMATRILMYQIWMGLSSAEKALVERHTGAIRREAEAARAAALVQ